jgi:hypothetical protein
MAKSMERTLPLSQWIQAMKKVRMVKAPRFASQAIVEMEDGGDGEGKRDGRWISCRVAVEEQVS